MLFAEVGINDEVGTTVSAGTAGPARLTAGIAQSPSKKGIVAAGGTA